MCTTLLCPIFKKNRPMPVADLRLNTYCSWLDIKPYELMLIDYRWFEEHAYWSVVLCSLSHTGWGSRVTGYWFWLSAKFPVSCCALSDIKVKRYWSGFYCLWGDTEEILLRKKWRDIGVGSTVMGWYWRDTAFLRDGVLGLQ